MRRLVGIVLLVLGGSHAAMADDPRPTSQFGSMPNGWAGYSLEQHGLADSHSRPPLAPPHGHHGHGHHGHGHHGHHGHGHHGHGHHGHGHHGHGHHGHGHHGHWHHGVPIFGFSSLYTTSGIALSYGVPAIAPSPWAQRWQALQLQQIAAGGADRAAIPQQAADRAAAAAQPAADAELDQAAEIRRRVAMLRESKPGGRQRADRLIAIADRSFADQDYRRATSKYRQAVAQAADYATAHFRLGHAYVATGDLELALTSFLIGLELSGAVERAGFSLEDMYRGDELAKQTHLHTLSDAALRQPEDGGLRMLVGMSLYYDGQPLRARTYFEQAARLPGPQQTYARMFFPADALDQLEAARELEAAR